MDVANIGRRMRSLNKGDTFLPYSRVIINVGVDDDGNEVSYVAGNTSGYTLEVTCPWGTQQMANDMLARVQGYQYQPYNAGTVQVDPAAEIGDAVSSTRVYGGLYKQDITFNKLFASDISAPNEEQIDHEYPYVDQTTRAILRQEKEMKAEFRITNDAISAEVARATGREGVLSGRLDVQSEEISAKVSKTGGNASSFSWSLQSDNFSLYANNKQVFRCTSSGVLIDGEIRARSGYIGTNTSGFHIGDKAIYNGVTGMEDSSHTGVYVGTDGIRLGKGIFSVDKSGNLTATGTITAKSGYIGNGTSGFKIGNTYIRNGVESITDASHNGIYLGTDGMRLGKGVFTVSNQGKVTATNVELTGKVTATSGYIGDGSNGFTIGGTFIRNGMTSLSDTSHVGVYVGTDGIALGKGAFKVTSAGVLTAKGTIDSEDGTIGGASGFTIATNKIYKSKSTYSDTTTSGVYIGTDGIALGTDGFKVSSFGALVAKSVNLTGKITATSGYIGTVENGFVIDNNCIRNGITSISDVKHNGVYVGTDGIALGKGSFKVTSTGVLTVSGGNIESGTLGSATGFTIDKNKIYKSKPTITDNTKGVYIGTDGIALGTDQFMVTSAGVLTAKSVNLTGKITATSGYIGTEAVGFTIGSSSTVASLKSGMTSISDTTNNGVYLGTDGIALGKGAFKVTASGVLTASGSINSDTGSIGGSSGFAITTNAIYRLKNAIDDDQHDGVYIGTNGIALGKTAFKVTNKGVLTATSVNLSGKITATSGFIGSEVSGFTIGAKSIYNGMPSRDYVKLTVGTPGGTGTIPMRSGASSSASILKRIPDGTDVTKNTSLEQFSGWTTVTYDGSSGYVETASVTSTGVYVGTDGIALGRGAFKVTSAGVLTVSGGKLGGSSGFTIDTKKIYNGMTTLDDTANGVYIGTDGIALGKGAFKVTRAGTLTAKKGYIGNGSSGFEIGGTYIRNGMESMSDTLNDGVYVGTNGIALGKGNFKVDKAGNVTANNGTFGGTVYAKNISITGGAITGSQIGGSTITGGNIQGGAVSKAKTSSGVQTSLDNGDEAKDTVTKLMAGSVSASRLYADILFVRDSSWLVSQAAWRSKSFVDGEGNTVNISYLGRNA